MLRSVDGKESSDIGVNGSFCTDHCWITCDVLSLTGFDWFCITVDIRVGIKLQRGIHNARLSFVSAWNIVLMIHTCNFGVVIGHLVHMYLNDPACSVLVLFRLKRP